MKLPFVDQGQIGLPFWAFGTSSPVNVLLVDDDKDEAVLTRSLLARVSDVKYELDWVATYGEGLASIAQNGHDAFLIDHQLGARTGVELVREARAAGSLAALVMLTGHRDRATDVAAMDAGATDFLMKGRTDAALLDRTLRYAMSQSAVMTALRRSHDQVAGLEEIGRILLDEGPTPTVMQHVVDLIADRFFLDRVAIFIADGDTLDLAGQYGYEHLQPSLSLSDSSVQRILRARQPIFLPSLSQELGASGHAVATELSVPLRVDGEVLGLMTVASFVATPIGEADYAAIRVIGDRLTAALAVTRERTVAMEKIARARLEPRRGDAGGILDPETSTYRREMLEPLVEMARKLGASRRGGKLGMLLVSLDDTSDGGLNRLAATIRLVFRDCPIVRFGRHEFGVLLGHTEAPSAGPKVAELTARAASAGMTVWCGYSSLAPHVGTPHLIAAAEMGLAQARRVEAGPHA